MTAVHTSADRRFASAPNAKIIAATAAVSAALVAAPMLLGYWTQGLRGVISFFAADTFYYLAVARHAGSMTGFTYDGEHPTNGFHPLWQWWLNTWFSIVPTLADRQNQVMFCWASSLVFSCLSAAIIASVCYRLTKSAAISIFAAVPGFPYLILSLADRNYGCTWGYVNGTESAVSMLMFSVLLAMSFGSLGNRIQATPSGRIMWGAAATLVVLSRLDDVFLLPAFAWPLLADSLPWRDRFVRYAQSVAAPAVAISFYCIYNLSYAGSMLPVSGLLKGGLSYSNLAVTISRIVPIQEILDRGWPPNWNSYGWHVAHLAVPAVIAGMWLFAKRDNLGSHRFRDARVLQALCIYVLLKAAYNLLCVKYSHQGHWYYANSVVTASLVTGTLLSKQSTEKIDKRRATAWALTCLITVIFAGNCLLADKVNLKYNARYFEYFVNRNALSAGLRSKCGDSVKVVGFDDGIDSYSIDVPVMSGLGFTLDLPAAKALKAGRLLDVAYDRGYRVLTSMNYMPPFEAAIGDDVSSVISRVFWLINERDLDRWTFRLVWIDPNSDAKFISFEPKN